MTDIRASLHTILDTAREETGVPGLALSLAHRGNRYFAASGAARVGTGMVITDQARFDVSCLMKFFLSVTALKLAKRGALDLQADIATILPELGPAHGIRLIHLMSHASGYHGLDITDMSVRWNSRWESFAERFRQSLQLFPPGSTFNYEHSEHVILGEALRRLFGRAPCLLAHEMLLAPAGVRLREAGTEEAGISPHAYSPQKQGYAPARLPPFGPFWEASLPAMTITLDDVSKAVSAAFADDEIADTLSVPVIGLPEMARSAPRAEQPPRQFSAACGLYAAGLMGHNGSMAGQTLGFRFDPRTGAIAAAGVNAYAPHARDSVLRKALELVAGRDDAQAAAPQLNYPAEFLFGGLPLDMLEGRYTGSYLSEVTIARQGQDLRVTVGPAGNRQSSFRILSQDGGHVIESRMPVALRFEKGPGGHPCLFLGVHTYRAVAEAHHSATAPVIAETVNGI